MIVTRLRERKVQRPLQLFLERSELVLVHDTLAAGGEG